MCALTFHGQHEPRGREALRVARLARVIAGVVAEHAGYVHAGIPDSAAAQRVHGLFVFEPLVRDLGRPAFGQQRDDDVVAFGGRHRIRVRVECRFVCGNGKTERRQRARQRR